MTRKDATRSTMSTQSVADVCAELGGETFGADPVEAIAARLAEAVAKRVSQLVREASGETLQRGALLTPAEVRAFLNVSRPTLEKLVREGLPHVSIGTDRRYNPGEVITWLKSRSSRDS